MSLYFARRNDSDRGHLRIDLMTHIILSIAACLNGNKERSEGGVFMTSAPSWALLLVLLSSHFRSAQGQNRVFDVLSKKHTSQSCGHWNNLFKSSCTSQHAERTLPSFQVEECRSNSFFVPFTKLKTVIFSLMHCMSCDSHLCVEFRALLTAVF